MIALTTLMMLLSACDNKDTGALDSADGVDSAPPGDGGDDTGSAGVDTEGGDDTGGGDSGDPGPVGDADGDGFTTEDGDCDDDNDAVYPGADELCNGEDDDCDGLIDAEDEDLLGGWLVYPDEDGDGHGAPGDAVLTCEDLKGWAASDDDCDDADGATYPGAVEICGDGVVNDCDGSEEDALAACGEMSLTSAYVEYQGTAFDDQAGRSVSAAGDLDGDGRMDMVIGAPHYNISTGVNEPGQAYVVLGGDTGAVSLDSAYAILTGEAAYDTAGMAVAGVGDQTGDGVPDLLVGAPAHNESRWADSGVVYLVSGDVSGDQALADVGVLLSGDCSNCNAGRTLDGGGDMDGDGAADLVIGAYYANNTGAAYVYTTPPAVDSTLALSADYVLSGVGNYSLTAYSLAMVPDTDGDGLDDVLIGALGDNTAGIYAGAAYLVSGASLTDLSLADADATFYGESASDYAGSAVAGLGDYDGDGLGDLVIGASAEHTAGTQAGAAYVVLGGASGAAGLGSAAALKVTGEAAYDNAGVAVGQGGDVTGDGLADALVGASANDAGARDAGAVYVLSGAATGTASAGDFHRIEGLGQTDYLGLSMDTLGDIDGDGLDDLLLGAFGRTHVASSCGSAFVVLGSWY